MTGMSECPRSHDKTPRVTSIFIHRSATHSQVVQLLKASGARPSLLVACSTGSRRASLVSTTSSQRSSSSRGTRLQSTAFKEKVQCIQMRGRGHDVGGAMMGVAMMWDG